MTYVPTLNTRRLRLRPFKAEDFSAYAHLCADAEIMRFLGEGRTLPRAEAWRSLAVQVGHWELHGFGMWALELRETGEFAGRVGFLEPEGWPGFELGWVVARRHWGRGLATEAAKAALTYCFAAMGREHVVSLIRPDNARSVRVADKLGETLEGRTDLMGGPVLVYGIHRQCWRERWRIPEETNGCLVEPTGPLDEEWVESLMVERWGAPIVVIAGEIVRPRELNGFKALRGERKAGLLTFRKLGGCWEIVTLDSLVEGEGVGTALLEAAKAAALREGCRLLRLTTTNDNLHALGFYQRRGFRLAALRPGAVEEARRAKPSIPIVGMSGISLSDELDLECPLDCDPAS